MRRSPQDDVEGTPRKLRFGYLHRPLSLRLETTRSPRDMTHIGTNQSDPVPLHRKPLATRSGTDPSALGSHQSKALS